MRRVLFEVEYDEMQGEACPDGLDIFRALNESHPLSVQSVKAIQDMEGEFKDNYVYETEIAPLITTSHGQCACCSNMGGHVYGVSVNGINEFVSNVLYNAVKKGVRSVRVIVREL